MKNHDHHTEARQEFLRNIPRETALQMRVAQARAAMGEKYLCHPANRVQRINVKAPVLK